MKSGTICYILASSNSPLAQGKVLRTDETLIYIKLLEEGISLEGHSELQIVSEDSETPPLGCVFVRQERDTAVLRQKQTLGKELRRSLLIEAPFDSFVYPVADEWKGRQAIRTRDLSCGGVAFFTSGDFQVGQCLEVVIPVTIQPLILNCQILRKKENDGDYFYAAKFINMSPDEEQVVQQAVFSIQLGTRPRQRRGST